MKINFDDRHPRGPILHYTAGNGWSWVLCECGVLGWINLGNKPDCDYCAAPQLQPHPQQDVLSAAYLIGGPLAVVALVAQDVDHG